MNRHVTELTWSKWLGDELGWLERRRLARHVASCAKCRETKDEILRERAAFDAAPERAEDLRRLSKRAAPSPPPRWWWIAAPAFAAAVALAIVLLPDGPDLRAKGDLFVVYVLRDGKSQPLGDTCRPGERVRARYASEKRYVLIAEVDATKKVTVLHSAPASRGPALTDGSWVLDETLGLERFIAVFSDEPVDRAALEAAAQNRPAAIPGAAVLEATCEKSR